ncbi:MAG: tetratricopeptide repeat protein [Bacteroidales bacterium]|nr:tetratricopeptide repeat protein [Bacteroidales bacterium]
MSKKLIISAVAALAITSASGQQVNGYDAQGFLTRAELMLRDNNFDGCLDQLQQAVRQGLAPASAEQADWLAAKANTSINPQDGAQLYRQFLNNYPASPRRGLAHLAIASIHYDQGEYAYAIRQLEAVNPQTLDLSHQAEYRLKLGFSYLKIGEYDLADQQFAALGQLKGHSNDARFYQGYVAYAKGDYRRAKELLRGVDTSTSPCNMADFYLAQIYFQDGEYQQALSTANKLIRNPQDADTEFVAEAYRIVGESQYNLGNDREAVAALKKYFQLEPEGLPSARYIMGMSQYRDGDYEQAIATLTPVTEQLNPMGQSAYLFIGQSYLKLGNANSATLALDKAVNLGYDPDVTETAFYNYAVAKMQGGRVPFGSSVTTFEDFLSRYPRSRYAPQVEEYIIAGYLTDNNYEAALASINRLSNPSDATLAAKQQILYTLGSRDIASNNIARGLDRLRQAQDIDEGSKTVSDECEIWIGDGLYAQGKYSQAATAYKNYLNSLTRQSETAANRPLATYNLGYAQFSSKDYSSALTSFTSYVNSPGNTTQQMEADAYNRIGDCYYYQNQFAQAAKQYEKAYDLAPSGGDYALYQQAIMKGLARDHKGKITGLQEMMKQFPRSSLCPSALLEMAESYNELGDNAKAIDTYNQLTKSYPNTAQGRQGYLLLAITYMDQGQRDKAISSYKTVLSRYPSSEEAKVAVDDLKRIYADMGQLDHFQSYLATIPSAPQMDVTEVETLTFQAAEKDYTANGNIAKLEKYLQQYPKGADAATALGYLAEAYAAKDNDKQALAYATKVVNDYPDSRAMETALAIKADVEYRQGKGEVALNTYKQLLDRASTPSNLNTARMGILRVNRDLGNHKEVVKIADEILGSSTITAAERDEATFARGYAAMRQGQTAQAAKDWESLTGDMRTEIGAKSAFYLAQMYYDEGNLKKAKKLADKLIDSDTPQHYWLARGFILMSDINRKEGNTFEANEYLKSLKENYPGSEPDIFNLIDQRLK